MPFTSYFKVPKAKPNRPESPRPNSEPEADENPGPQQSSATSRRSASLPPPRFQDSLGSTSSLQRSRSLYRGAESSSDPEYIINLRSDVIVNWIHVKQEEKIWTTGQPGEGVVLRKTKGRFVCCPSHLQYDGSQFYQMVAELNVRAAMTVTTRVIKLILQRTNAPYVQLGARHQLQVLDDITDLPHCQKNQCAAFIASQGNLVVWADDPGVLLERASYIQDALMNMIWGQDYGVSGEEKRLPFVETTMCEEDDEESAEQRPRRTVLNQAFITAATLVLVVAAIGGGWSRIVVELLVDWNWVRMAFLACFIPQLWLALFFFQALVGNFAQLLGPIGQMNENSKYYSGLPPKKLSRDREEGLPHITIQMPVYTEGLQAVIAPTIRSVKDAILTYELQGGTANIFINDDGMQVIDDELAQERQDFYEEQGIGWVARPRHDPRGERGKPFIRAGKFKKASNLNYALGLSIAVEDKLANIDRPLDWNKRDENRAYYRALKEAREERGGEAWADGDIRIGDFILLIDADTRLPQDCFLEAVSEMVQSPQVGVLQYSSGVYNVTNSFFEKAITFFTDLIYTQVRFSVANGDVSPFVGHNAVIRWSAMQEVAKYDEKEKREVFWSEKTVSEDFDMALRLQNAGYHIRLAAYKGDGYKEGVSLTVYDELMRWEKYAYGCSELIFHPLKDWPTKSPFTKLFREFVVSPMPLPSKFTIMAYIGTYYALGSAWLFTFANYFLVGWYNTYLDHYYIDSFKVYFSIIIIFTFLGNLALAVLRYRINEKGLVASLAENVMWIPLFIIFLGGVSLHVSQALVSHLLGIEMSWGSTAKELDHTPFFQEIPKVIGKFKWTFAGCLAGVGTIVYLAKFAPAMWRIDFFTPIWPLASVLMSHFLLPIVLNPNLMLFTW